MTQIQSICVYCGSNPGHNPLYIKAAEQLGATFARNHIRLVYGGGTKGLMGAVARGVKANGGAVTGIIPHFLLNKEASQEDLALVDDLVVTENMHERKRRMFEQSDAFVTLPGGIGTLEEITEMMTWAQLGHHVKPLVYANINGFWNPVLALFDHMKAEGFIHATTKVKPLVIDMVEDIVPQIVTAVQTNSNA